MGKEVSSIGVVNPLCICMLLRNSVALLTSEPGDLENNPRQKLL